MGNKSRKILLQKVSQKQKQKKRQTKRKRQRQRQRQRQRKMHRCNIYKSCEHVPCGSTMNKCTPSYCVPGSSRNWSHCNMSNWGKDYEKYRSMCRDENKCKIKNTKKTKNTVDALTLHNKMPYIWRFLKPKTRKLMIELANKQVPEINIPGHIYPDLKKGTTIKKVIKNMTKKNRQQFLHLRKKYKKI